MHIFPGLNNFKGIEITWREDATSAFLDVLNEARDDVAFISGAHIHNNRLELQHSDKHPHLKVPLWVSPAVSPIYGNNPAFSTMHLTVNNDTKDVRFIDYKIHAYQ